MAKLSSHFKQALGTFESHSTSHSTKCRFAKAPFWSSWQRSAVTTHQVSEPSDSVPSLTSTIIHDLLLTDSAAAGLTTNRESSTSPSTATNSSRSSQGAIESQNAEGDHGMDVGIDKSMERRHGYAEAHFRWENSHPTQEANIQPRSERKSNQASEQPKPEPGSTSTVVLVVLLTDTAAAGLMMIRERPTSRIACRPLQKQAPNHEASKQATKSGARADFHIGLPALG
ncbi:uncharacterized protein BKA78DRAFT_292229 [Phyllosticta capitalensis]|uniref:Uncharacterized protein n=1 Tax=Phyllosticta capitalensis TaxID=121624 RepID=A0ABR1YY05_9PEZI